MTASGPEPLDAAANLAARLSTLSSALLPIDQADAAVLILLRTGGAGLEVLAEQRAEQPGDPWSGQVGLPGGRTEPFDRSLTETVLRELREEVGLATSALDGPPRLFDTRRARPSGLRVAVFAGRLRQSETTPTGVDPQEVTTTFWLPLQALDLAESRPRSSVFGRINVDTVVYEDHMVWGFTLRALQDFVAWMVQADVTTPDSVRPARPTRGGAF